MATSYTFDKADDASEALRAFIEQVQENESLSLKTQENSVIPTYTISNANGESVATLTLKTGSAEIPHRVTLQRENNSGRFITLEQSFRTECLSCGGKEASREVSA